MPVLSNPRWERFAQELAKGKSATEAYIEAGYEENQARSAASRLLSTNVNTSVRVAELQEKGAAKVEITQDKLRQMLLEDREFAKECKQSSAAVAATTALGKLFGLFVEKTENFTLIRDISAVPLTDEQWAEQHSTVQ